MFTELFSLVRRRLLDQKSNILSVGIPTCPSLIKTNVSHRYSDLYAAGSNAILLIRWIRYVHRAVCPWFRISSKMDENCLTRNRTSFRLARLPATTGCFLYEHDRGVLREKRRPCRCKGLTYRFRDDSIVLQKID